MFSRNLFSWKKYLNEIFYKVRPTSWSNVRLINGECFLINKWLILPLPFVCKYIHGLILMNNRMYVNISSQQNEQHFFRPERNMLVFIQHLNPRLHSCIYSNVHHISYLTLSSGLSCHTADMMGIYLSSSLCLSVFQ